MKFLMGSHYWHLNIETSDNDYIEYITPTKADLYFGNFTSNQSKDKNGDDINTKDIRLIFKELKKGSLLSFQVLYSSEIEGNIEKEENKILKLIFTEFLSERDNILKEVKEMLIKSSTGELIGRVKKFENLKETKELANIIKLNFIIKTLIEGENPFIKWFEHQKRIAFLKEVRKMTSKEVEQKYSVEYKEALEYVNTLKEWERSKKKTTEILDELEKILMNELLK